MEALKQYYALVDENISDEKLKGLIHSIIETREDKFSTIPVSISFHGSDACKDGSRLELPPYSLDFNRLLTAIALHDIGKIMCYSKENNEWKYFGIDSKSHPAIGADIVKRQAHKDNLDVSEIITAIESHYGPYGNKQPESPLAWALHLIEMLDTKCKNENSQ
jgi:hypothetical protein